MSQEANNISQEAKHQAQTQAKQPECLQDVMKDLEQKVNPKSVAEGLTILTTINETHDKSILLKPMQDGANEFKKKVGRNMTYSEMREMWG